MPNTEEIDDEREYNQYDSLKVCMVTFYFYPEYSGSSIQALNLSRQLTRIGVKPFIVTANLSCQKNTEEFDGIKIFRVPVLRITNLKVISFWITLSWFLIRKRDDYDIIHAHGTLQHGPVSIMGRLLGKKSILKVAMADSDIAFYRQGRIWGRLNRFFVRVFDHYIATSKIIFEEFLKRELDIQKVFMIPNGVDVEINRPLYNEEEKSNLKRKLELPLLPLVVYSGIINSRKNIDFILEIWRKVIKVNVNCHLILVGPIPEAAPFYKMLLDYIDKYELNRHVSFLGYKESVVPYLQSSNVFLFPSKQEGMPNILLEAMACGLPCVVSKGSGMEDLIKDEVSGFVLNLGDRDRFVDTILKLLQRPELCKQIGSAARKHISEAFSLEKIACRYRYKYRDLTNQ